VLDRPLDGIRILDLTRLLPGAYATLILADLGAEVIKIEDPEGGDTMRALPVSPGAPDYFALLNRNKRSVTLNLRSPEAAPVLDALLSTADVVVDSFRPATARRLGVDSASLRSRHPRLITISIIGFGRGEPAGNSAAHDINFQAAAGLIRPPALPGPLVGDVGSAMQAAIAALAAIVARQKTNRGAGIDVTIAGAARAWALFPTTAELASPCYQIYEAADGRWLALGALETKFWRTFCERIERPDLLPFQHARGAEGERAIAEIRAVVRELTSDEWLERFHDADACLARVEPPSPPAAQTAAVPALGVDTDDVLGGAGIDASRRAGLRSAGVI
jgi:alpha-methylacyl-CoA racemase